MKNLKTFVIFSILVMVSFCVTAQSGKVKVVEAGTPNLFIFKINSVLKGAQVAMIHNSGEVVTSEKLMKRKMIIDFCGSKQGTYIIKITKGGFTKKFEVINDFSTGVQQTFKVAMSTSTSFQISI